MKKFNTEGTCNPSQDYTVDITDRLNKIKLMIEAGDYFTINRARQYGKTTTIAALEKFLRPEYLVLSLDFQDISFDNYKNEDSFSRTFSSLFIDAFNENEIDNTTGGLHPLFDQLESLISDEDKKVTLSSLFRVIKKICDLSTKPIVLIIDEVDTATGNQVFLDFLAQLRSLYLKRKKNSTFKTFQSVILAGVTDVKHLKSKIRDEDQHKVNSPWNIAADFLIDMSLSESGIAKMLEEYEAEHHTGMNTKDIAKSIHDYTSGYPFLVSRLCLIIDERLVPDKFSSLSDAWSMQGIDEAVKVLLAEKNTLFESLSGKLTNFPEIKQALRRILMEGEKITYNPDQEELVQLEAYGFIKNENNAVTISNRLFETRLYNLFLSEEEIDNNSFYKEGSLAKNIFVKDGVLDMPLILDHFIKTYTQVLGPLKDKFQEKDGRELFLLYIKPIINGTGNYYIEAQTRDQKRTDIIIDYIGKQYIIELKIWHGERYNSEGEKQISEYLDYFNLNTGYMLSFNFNKKKEVGIKQVKIGNKTLFEATI